MNITHANIIIHQDTPWYLRLLFLRRADRIIRFRLEDGGNGTLVPASGQTW